MASIGLDKHDIHAQLMQKSEHFHVLVSRLPSLNDCVVTKQTFWIVLLRLFSFKFCHILSTVGFINEDNYCHSQWIGQLIKEKLLKGIFKGDRLINVAANTQISPSLCKQTMNFFLHECFLEFFFFPEIMLECWGCGLYTSAAYTRVFTVIFLGWIWEGR